MLCVCRLIYHDCFEQDKDKLLCQIYEIQYSVVYKLFKCMCYMKCIYASKKDLS